MRIFNQLFLEGLKKNILTVSGHPDGYAFLQSAILTSISIYSQDTALLILCTWSILDLLLNATAEETL